MITLSFGAFLKYANVGNHPNMLPNSTTAPKFTHCSPIPRNTTGTTSQGTGDARGRGSGRAPAPLGGHGKTTYQSQRLTH